MPVTKINNLISELNEMFGSSEPSEQQKQLLESLQLHIHNASDIPPQDPTPLEIIETMLENLGDEHPRASLLLRQLLDTLKNIGV